MTLTVILAIGFALTLILSAAVAYLVDGFIGYMTFIGGIAIIIVTICVSGFQQSAQKRDATRAAIEERYNVDLPVSGFGREVTFVRDNLLYSCTITGTGTKARMYCDEPARAELDH